MYHYRRFERFAIGLDRKALEFPWLVAFSTANRGPSRIKSGTGFCRKMLQEVPSPAAAPKECKGWRSDLIRLFTLETALLVAPFVAYALFLWATRAGVLHPDSWPTRVLAVLGLIAVALTAAGFVMVAEYTGTPKNSTYVPAHIENGRLVPGSTK
jgi:hypothetical protein